MELIENIRSDQLELVAQYDSDVKDSDSNNNERTSKNKIFIRNLEWNVHENLLKHFLTKFGQVKKCKILRDSETSRSKGTGFVDFVDEIGVENVLKANQEELVLNGRRLFIDKYRKLPDSQKPKRSNQDRINKFTERSAEKIEPKPENKDSEVEFSSENLIDMLPYNVLVEIFSYLSLRDLCTVEQVCKRWYEVARITWSQKEKLILDTKHIFENFSFKRDNQYGFLCRPEFGKKAMFQIMSKNLKNLKYFDISEYHSKFGLQIGDILRMIAEGCPNISHLNLANLSASNKNFTPLIKSCPNLRAINITSARALSDASISKIFQHCPELEEFNFTNCREIKGSCFERVKPNNQKIKRVYLDECESLEDENLVMFLNRCKNIKLLSLKRQSDYLPNTLLYIINNSPKLETLLLSPCGFDSLRSYDPEGINFGNFESLRELDIGKSYCNNKLVETILKGIKTLKILHIDQCINLKDDPFINVDKSLSLEELNLSFNRHITDECLQSLSRFSECLKVLKIKGCSRFTTQGIKNMLHSLDKLEYLDVSLTNSVDNSVLETAISLNRHIYINCNDTNVDTNKFMFDHVEAKRESRDRNSPIFKFENLTFESLTTPFKLNTEKYQDNGMLYFGPPLDSDEDDYDFGGFNGDEDDYDQHNDLEEFLEEETEMYKEI